METKTTPVIATAGREKDLISLHLWTDYSMTGINVTAYLTVHEAESLIEKLRNKIDTMPRVMGPDDLGVAA